MGACVVLHRYLNIPNIVAAALSHGCTMLHPGYGFLAENATFVDICRDHGLNFIGPNVSCWEHCSIPTSMFTTCKDLGLRFDSCAVLGGVERGMLGTAIAVLFLKCENLVWYT